MNEAIILSVVSVFVIFLIISVVLIQNKGTLNDADNDIKSLSLEDIRINNRLDTISNDLLNYKTSIDTNTSSIASLSTISGTFFDYECTGVAGNLLTAIQTNNKKHIKIPKDVTYTFTASITLSGPTYIYLQENSTLNLSTYSFICGTNDLYIIGLSETECTINYGASAATYPFTGTGKLILHNLTFTSSSTSTLKTGIIIADTVTINGGTGTSSAIDFDALGCKSNNLKIVPNISTLSNIITTISYGVHHNLTIKKSGTNYTGNNVIIGANSEIYGLNYETSSAGSLGIRLYGSIHGLKNTNNNSNINLNCENGSTLYNSSLYNLTFGTKERLVFKNCNINGQLTNDCKESNFENCKFTYTAANLTLTTHTNNIYTSCIFENTVNIGASCSNLRFTNCHFEDIVSLIITSSPNNIIFNSCSFQAYPTMDAGYTLARLKNCIIGTANINEDDDFDFFIGNNHRYSTLSAFAASKPADNKTTTTVKIVESLTETNEVDFVATNFDNKNIYIYLTNDVVWTIDTITDNLINLSAVSNSNNTFMIGMHPTASITSTSTSTAHNMFEGTGIDFIVKGGTLDFSSSTNILIKEANGTEKVNLYDLTIKMPNSSTSSENKILLGGSVKSEYKNLTIVGGGSNSSYGITTVGGLFDNIYFKGTYGGTVTLFETTGNTMLNNLKTESNGTLTFYEGVYNNIYPHSTSQITMVLGNNVKLNNFKLYSISNAEYSDCSLNNGLITNDITFHANNNENKYSNIKFEGIIVVNGDNQMFSNCHFENNLTTTTTTCTYAMFTCCYCEGTYTDNGTNTQAAANRGITDS